MDFTTNAAARPSFYTAIINNNKNQQSTTNQQPATTTTTTTMTSSSMSNYSPMKKLSRPTIQFDTSESYNSDARSELSDWSSVSWRRNVEKLFETVEFQHTKSYRTPSSNNSNNRLFDQIMGVDGNSQAGGGGGAATNPNERKNSLNRTRQGSQTALGQTTKESVQSQTAKQSSSTLKSTNTMKRASVVSLKNTWVSHILEWKIKN